MRPFESLVVGEWAAEGPRPHVLILPHTTGYEEFWTAHQPVLEPYEKCVVAMPFQWTHVTVEAVRHQVSDATMDDFAVALADEMKQVDPFELQLGPTWTGRSGITVAVYPEGEITSVYDQTRAAMGRVPGVQIAPRPERFWPHSSLGYCIKPFDSSGLNACLYRDLRPPRVDMIVDRVHLVQQWQRPDLGYYTWQVHAEIPLGR